MRKLFALLVALALSVAPAFPAQAKTHHSKRVRHARARTAKRVVRPGISHLKRAKPAAKRTNRNNRNSYSKLKRRNIV